MTHATACMPPEALTLFGAVCAVAERHPDRAALLQQTQGSAELCAVTYGDLMARVAALQRKLTPLVGCAERSCIVGVHVELSVEYVVAVLASLSLGVPFLPLDPLWPEGKLEAMVADATPSVVVRSATAPAALRLPAQCAVVEVPATTSGAETPKHELSDASSTSQRCPRVAYVMYTSGSSGSPRGVCGTEQGILNRSRWMAEAYPYQPSDVCCCKTSPCFVDSVAEIFAPLLAGVPSLLVPPTLLSEPQAFLRLLATGGVTRLVAVPAFLRLLIAVVADPSSSPLPPLSLLVSSGEPLSVGLWRALCDAFPGVRVLNLYGMTEAAADSTCFDPEQAVREGTWACPNDPEAHLPIGRPIHSTWVALVDPEMQLITSDDRTGELCIASVGVARNYLHPGERDGERFVQWSSKWAAIMGSQAEGLCVYRTGDEARRDSRGWLELCGRRDQHVKIETVLQRHPAVEAAAARLRTPPLTGVTAFVSLATRQCGHDADTTVGALETELLKLCRSRLLSVAIPARVVLLSELPRTPAGKLDRKALPPDDAQLPHLPPEVKRRRVNDAAEGDSLRRSAIIPQRVRAAMEEALPGRGAAIGAEDDLLTHGITSVGAALIAFRLKLAMSDIYKHRTPRRIASLLTAHASTTSTSTGASSDSVAEAAHPPPSPQATSAVTSAEEEEPSQSLSPARSAATLRCSFSRAGGFHVHHDRQDSGAQHSAERALDRPALHTDSLHGRRRSFHTTWRAGLGKCIDASPLLVLDDLAQWSVVAASHAGRVMRLNGDSGEPMWTTQLPDRVEASPVVVADGAAVAVGCYDGFLYVLAASHGGIAWRYHLGDAVKCTAAVDPLDGLVWCGSHGRRCAALDVQRRRAVVDVVMSSSVSASAAFDASRRQAYVCLLDGTVLALRSRRCDDDTDIAAAEIDREHVEIHGERHETAWKARRAAPVFSTPVVVRHTGVLLVAAVDGSLCALDGDCGAASWQINLGAPLFAPLCLVDADALAVVGAQDGAVYGVSTADGSTVWRHRVGAAITAAPGIALSEDGEHEQSALCCLCGNNGQVVVLALPNGQLQRSSVEEVARMHLPGDVFSSPVMVRNRVYVGCRDDHLYCLELRREQSLATGPPLAALPPSCDE